MDTVKITSKYQIKIPVKVRESLNLKPGQKLRILSFNNRIELIPDIQIEETRGMLKGINTDFEREPDRL